MLSYIDYTEFRTSMEQGDIDASIRAISENYAALKCQLGITCFNAPIGFVENDEGSDTHFVLVVALINPHEVDKPVFACEDCAGWLEETLDARRR